MDNLLEFDSTGSNIDNLVMNETHSLPSSSYKIVTPLAGSFYTKGFILKLAYNDVELILGTDYLFTDIVSQVVFLTGRAAADGIRIINGGISGDIKLIYQAVGGEKVGQQLDVLEMLSKLDDLNSTSVPFASVPGKPLGYTPAPHTHALIDGLARVHRIRNQIIEFRRSMMDQHLVQDPNVTVKQAVHMLLTVVEIQTIDLNNLSKYGDILLGLESSLTGFGPQVDTVVEATDEAILLTTQAITDIDLMQEKTSDIQIPVILTPLNNSVGFENPDTFTVEPYVTSSLFEGLHVATDWELSENSDFTNIVSSSVNDGVNLIEHILDNMYVNTNYFLRVRFRSDNHVSEWAISAFSTAADLGIITTPIISVPSNDAVDMPLEVTILASVYNITNIVDNHLYSDWQIATDVGFNTVVYESLNSTDLESHTITSNLNSLTEYYVRVRYKGSSHISVWSAIVHFTTANVVIQESFAYIRNIPGEYVNTGSLLYDSIYDRYIVVTIDYAINVMSVVRLNLDFSLDAVAHFTLTDLTTIYKVILNPDSHTYALVGYQYSSVYVKRLPLIILIDNNLNFVSAKLIRDTTTPTDGFFGDIIYDPNTTNYVCVGTNNGTYGAGSFDGEGIISVFDNGLNLVNSKVYTYINWCRFNAVTLDPVTEEYIVTGYVRDVDSAGSATLLVTFNTNLAIIRSNAIRTLGNDISYEIVYNPITDNFIATGKGYNSGAPFTYSSVLFELNRNFTIVKAIGVHEGSSTRGISLNVHPNTGKIILGGVFQPSGQTYGWICELDKELNFIKDKLMTGMNGFRDIQIHPVSKSYVCHGVGYINGSRTMITFSILDNLTLVNGNLDVLDNGSILDGINPFSTIPISYNLAFVLTDQGKSMVESAPSFPDTTANTSVTVVPY